MRNQREEYPISIQASPEFAQGGLSAFVVGAASIDGWVEVSGVRVSSIAAGTTFKIWATFSAVNAAPGIPIGWTWCVTMTVIDTVGGVVKNWRRKDSSYPEVIGDLSNLIRGTLELNRMGANVMPNHALNLRFKIFGNDIFSPTPEYPDLTLW